MKKNQAVDIQWHMTIDKKAKAVLWKKAKQKTDKEMVTLIKQQRQICEIKPRKRQTMKWQHWWNSNKNYVKERRAKDRQWNEDIDKIAKKPMWKKAKKKTDNEMVILIKKTKAVMRKRAKQNTDNGIATLIKKQRQLC